MTNITISNAIDEIENFISKLQINNTDLTSAKGSLISLRNLVGDSLKLNNDISKFVSQIAGYDSARPTHEIGSDDFNIWAKGLYAAVLEFEKKCREQLINGTYNEARKFFDKNRKCRTTVIISFLVLVVLISVVAAVLAIYGQIKDLQWGNTVAGILGTVDFAVGILGFSIERISDMKAQKVSRSLSEVERAKSMDSEHLDEAISNFKKCTIIYKSRLNSPSARKTGKGSTVLQNVNGKQDETIDSEHLKKTTTNSDDVTGKCTIIYESEIDSPSAYKTGKGSTVAQNVTMKKGNYKQEETEPVKNLKEAMSALSETFKRLNKK